MDLTHSPAEPLLSITKSALGQRPKDVLNAFCRKYGLTAGHSGRGEFSVKKDSVDAIWNYVSEYCNAIATCDWWYLQRQGVNSPNGGRTPKHETCGSGPLRGMAGYSSSVASSSISLITFQTSWQLKKLQLKQWKAANSIYGNHNYRLQCLSMISNTDVIMVFQHLASPVTQLCHSVSFRILHLIRYQIVFIKLYENKVAMEKKHILYIII